MPRRPPALLRVAVIAGVLGAALAACDGAAPSSAAPTAPQAVARPAVVQHDAIPLDGAIDYNPCTGETVVLAGSARLVRTAATDATGAVHWTFHINWGGVTGTGLTSGATYTAVTANNAAVTAQSDGSNTGTQAETRLMIARGPAPDYALHYTARWALDAADNLTVQFEHLRAECRG